MHSFHGRWHCRTTSNKEPWHIVHGLNPSHVSIDLASMGCNALVHMWHHGLPHSLECSEICPYSVIGYVDTMVKGLNIRNRLTVHNAFQMPPQVKIQGVWVRLSSRPCNTASTSYPTSGEDVEVSVNINVEVDWRSIVLQPRCLSSCQRHSRTMEVACFAGKSDTFLRPGVAEAELVQVGSQYYIH